MECIIEDRIRLNEHVYSPISIVCHIGGSINGGHYVNYSRRLEYHSQPIVTGDWYLYNDNYVTKINDLNTHMKTAGYNPFILCLKRVV